MYLQPGDAYMTLKVIGVLIFIIVGTIRLVHLRFSFIKSFLLCSMMAIAAFAGSKLWYITQHLLGREYYRVSHWNTVWYETGAVFYGWQVGGLIAAIIFCRWVKWPIYTLLNTVIVPGALIAQILNRLGCLEAGCCFGKPLNAPWAIYNPDAGRLLHPVQLYEAAFDFILLLVLPNLKKFSDAQKVWSYFIGYAVGRFFLEFLRGDNLPVFLGMTVPQITSLCVLILVFLASYFQPSPLARPSDSTK